MRNSPAVYAISVLAALHPAARSAPSDHQSLATGLDCKAAKPAVEVEAQDDDMEKGHVDSGVVVSAGPSRRGTGTTVSDGDGEIVVVEADVVDAVQREEPAYEPGRSSPAGQLGPVSLPKTPIESGAVWVRD